MHDVASLLLKTILKQGAIRAGDRVAAAVSGGADSMALLRLLLELRTELGIVLSVAHVNHKLRGEESDGDERFVAELAQRHGLELHLYSAPDSAPVERSTLVGTPDAAKRASGFEARARKMRYGFFRDLARGGRVTKIATAHTIDDQAETVLLRIFRGTGIRGLSGIHSCIRFEDETGVYGEVIRPLLPFRRAALRQYLRECGQDWREDSSNRDIAFLRNRLRHRLLPLIAEDFGEAAVEHLAELAEIARAEEEHWEADHPEVQSPLLRSSLLQSSLLQSSQFRSFDEGDACNAGRDVSLPLGLLRDLPLAAQRRFVRGWLEANAPGPKTSFRLTEEVLDLARGDTGRKMELRGGWMIQRRAQDLLLHPLLRADSVGGWRVADYEYRLEIPGSVEIAELGICIEARVMDCNRVQEDDRRQLLSLESMPARILIRNWRAGDRYWPAHTASEKKVKELLSDLHATGAEKKLWPVAVAEGCGIIWMRGFGVPSLFQAPAAAERAILIRDLGA